MSTVETERTGLSSRADGERHYRKITLEKSVLKGLINAGEVGN
jgi:hypothetical protein